MQAAAVPQVAVAGEGQCWVASGEKEQTGSPLLTTPLHKHKLLLGTSFTLAQSRNQGVKLLPTLQWHL